MSRVIRNLEELTNDLDNISITISSVADAIDKSDPRTLDVVSVKDVLFGLCAHLDRVVEDLSQL